LAVLTVDGRTLRTLRLQRGWSQKDLARAAGIRQGTVSAIENGKRARPSTVRLIADALDVGVPDVATIT